MIQRFTAITVPLYVVLMILVVLSGSVLVAAKFYRQQIDAYTFFLPEAKDASGQFAYGSWPALQNSDFYKSVRDKFRQEKTDFIEADISAMRLTVFRAGEAKLTVPILSTGKTGSWWETPAGLYRVESKENKHFSTFGQVYQPWSLAFQGNFFIHGWPYYPDGTPVQPGYSGGCIRLSTEDAKQVYDMVNVGTPVLVFRNSKLGDAVRYSVRQPAVPAQQYLVADMGSNFILAQKGVDKPAPIASITKLITALVATEYINLDREITIAKSMIVPTSKPRLWPGERVRAFDLMYPLLMESSNEAAEVFAQTVGKERFVALMNSKAKALGLKNTYFTDPAGVNADNVSTPADLFALLKYMYANQSFFLRVSAGRAPEQEADSPFRGMENLNGFGGWGEFAGGKIGKSTEAAETMASVFEIEVGAGKRPVAIIVLGSDNSIRDTSALLAHTKDNYEASTADLPASAQQ